MSVNKAKKVPMFPIKNVIGFVLSLILTFVALGLGIAHIMPFGIVMMVLMFFAVLQIAVQLYFFMHFMESDGPPFHVAGMAIAVIFVIAIVGLSVWIMSFNSMSH